MWGITLWALPYPADWIPIVLIQPFWGRLWGVLILSYIVTAVDLYGICTGIIVPLLDQMFTADTEPIPYSSTAPRKKSLYWFIKGIWRKMNYFKKNDLTAFLMYGNVFVQFPFFDSHTATDSDLGGRTSHLWFLQRRPDRYYWDLVSNATDRSSIWLTPRMFDDVARMTRIGNVASILRRFKARTNTDEQSTHAS